MNFANGAAVIRLPMCPGPIAGIGLDHEDRAEEMEDPRSYQVQLLASILEGQGRLSAGQDAVLSRLQVLQDRQSLMETQMREIERRIGRIETEAAAQGAKIDERHRIHDDHEREERVRRETQEKEERERRVAVVNELSDLTRHKLKVSTVLSVLGGLLFFILALLRWNWDMLVAWLRTKM